MLERRSRDYWAGIVAGTFVLLAGGLNAEDDVQRAFFESKIRPLLVEKCQSCHEGDKPESQLNVDSLEGLLRGGIRGAAVVPGKPGESVLISAVKHGEILKMPPKEKLSAAQIADLVKWVETGAYWPDAAPVTIAAKHPASAEPELTPEQKSFWAFQRPQRPAIPEAVRVGEFFSPIDRFVDVQLAAANYAAASLAEKRILLRRVTLDLIGVTPSPEEWQDFLADDSPDAFSRVIDRLLASPAYGEKWGRHWLDVARYGDSNGLDENMAHANAFRYRDYVVDAFNKDKPYDQFVREQIAGDLLPDGGEEQQLSEQMVATGFLSIGAKMLAEDDPVKMQMDIIDEQVDTLGKAFLGMTFGCARCHHHKFDPISAQDYYGLAGIFKSTKTMDTFTVVARWQERPLTSLEKARDLAESREALAAKQREIDQLIAAANQRVQAEARRQFGDYLFYVAQQERLDRVLANRQPLGNRSDAANLPNAILVEGENFARGNVLKDVSNYGPEIGVLVNRGESPNYVEYDLEIPEAGKYQIELRYAAAESRPCRLFIDSKELKSDAASSVTGGWHPDRQAWHIEGVYELPAGKVTLRLEQPNAFPHLDKLLIAPGSELPTPAAFAKRSADFAPLPHFVKQLQKTLSKTTEEAGEVFAAWRAAAEKYVSAPDEEIELPLQSIRALADEFQQRSEKILAVKAEKPDASANDPLEAILFDPKGPFAPPKDKDQEIGYPAETVATLKMLREEKTVLNAAVPVYPEAMAVSDQSSEDLRVHFRGSHLTLGEQVPRRFPRALGGESASSSLQGSGRLELSQWLTQADHPLTARVMANRVWGWHFGQGIVRSVDNFGLLGEPPTHPELLDWLATELPRRSWSLKQLHREMLSTALYQRSGNVDAHQREHDPENRLWGRYPRRRMEVEELRDSILATAGTLNTQMRGSLLTTPNRSYVTSTASVNPAVYRTNRRSIYLPVVRSAVYEVFQAFDFADPNVSSGQRQSTTVAPQALFLMNSEFVSQQTLAWADELLMYSEDDATRLHAAYQRALGREPTAEETTRAVKFLTAYREQVDGAESQRRAWQSLCRALISTNEFVFVE